MRGQRVTDTRCGPTLESVPEPERCDTHQSEVDIKWWVHLWMHAGQVWATYLTRAHLRANLIAPSLASVPVLQKKALSPKLFSTKRLARSTCAHQDRKCKCMCMLMAPCKRKDSSRLERHRVGALPRRMPHHDPPAPSCGTGCWYVPACRPAPPACSASVSRCAPAH